VNAPNLISLARLAAVPVVVWLILSSKYTWAFGVFVAAGISDAVDGLIAKRFNAETAVGRYLDPLADKALLMSVFVALGHEGHLPLWLVILVVSRDVMILAGAVIGLILMEHYRVTPSLTSKVNTTAQIVLACVVLAELGAGIGYDELTLVLHYVVAATTLISGAMYVARWMRLSTEIEDAR
jgi:cardiolipin synthase